MKTQKESEMALIPAAFVLVISRAELPELSGVGVGAQQKKLKVQAPSTAAATGGWLQA